MNFNGLSDADLLAAHEATRHATCRSQCENFIQIAEIDKLEMWRDAGCRDMVEWVSAHYDINSWKARRWVKAAHALAKLPAVSKAFATGGLSYRQGRGADPVRSSPGRRASHQVGDQGQGLHR